jgi:hypothetical protein
MKGAMFTYVIDEYDRRARLYPALLCFVPAIAVAVGVYGEEFTVSKGLLSLAISFGFIALLISVARDSGKKREPKLFTKWGGKPTTLVLRHRDHTIDTVTKRTYHEFLGKHLGVLFPTIDEESRNPVGADDKYDAGVRWLLEKTRDKKKFPFVFRENVNYGFRRNCLGLKPLGILGSLLGVLWTLGAIHVLTLKGASLHDLEAADTGAKVALLTCVLLLLIWSFYITAESVKRVAFTYADMLLRSCDKLPKKRS